MDNKDNVDLDNWTLIDPIEVAESETPIVDEHQKNNEEESDLESDGISIISHNESVEEEPLQDTGTNHNIENVTLLSKENTIKWTLADSDIDSADALSDQPSRPFYLNCLEEPVQELSDHEMGSNHSDSESDEVALISENGNDVELKDNIENKNLAVIMAIPIQIQYSSRLVIVAFFVAAISMLLGRHMYCSDQIEGNSDNISKETFDGIDEISKKYNMSTTLYLCEQKYRSGNNSAEQNIHKCLIRLEADMKKRQDKERKREIKEFAKNLKMKEIYLNEKEAFLIQRENELVNAQNKVKKNEKHNFKEKKTRSKIYSDENELVDAQNKVKKNEKHNFKEKKTRSKIYSDHGLYKTGFDHEYKKSRVKKDSFGSKMKSKTELNDKKRRKSHWKNIGKDMINDSKDVLKTVKLSVDRESEKYFKLKKGHKKKHDYVQKPKQKNKSKNVQTLINSEEVYYKNGGKKKKKFFKQFSKMI